MFHSAEMELQDVTVPILDDVERVNPSAVVIDSLSEIRLLSGDLLRFRRDAPVDVEVGRAPDGVRVSVHNEGAPIAPDEQLQVFDRFSRARGAEARAKGWGLGLTLVRGCVEAHGGRLELSSTDEAGTTFTLWLPLDARPFQAPPAPG